MKQVSAGKKLKQTGLVFYVESSNRVILRG